MASCLAMGGAIAFCDSAIAQIAPDATLGSESSVVTPQTPDSPVDVISGGATRGANLFHSFEQFSVQTGRTAFFNNAADIQNIISRVTGSSISNIDGLIRANGLANLFFINPNGIIFGQNARLDIGGSFIASTASSLKFADGLEFSAITPQTKPLLSVNVPLGLQYGEKTGDIRVQGIGGSSASQQMLGLILPSNKTLALVGGNVILEGAFLNVPGGRIELGSVTGVGQVNLSQTNQGWTLNYQNARTFGNIQLSRSFVDIAIEEDSSIYNQAESGAVSIRGSQLNLERSSIVRANTFTSAAAGNVSIDVQRLIMRGGAQVRTTTFGTGPGGNLTVNASESVELAGELIGAGFISASGLYSATNGSGQAGSVTITTPILLIQAGAQVNASTVSSGKGGNVTVTANKVHLIGRTANDLSASGLASLTQGVGDAGSVIINTQELLIEDGAAVSTATFAPGKGGNLAVLADSVQLIGRSVGGRPSNLSAQARSAGDGGTLRINTQQLLIRDGAGVFVESRGTGNAGNVTIAADSTRLDNGTLRADTRSANTNPAQPQATITLRAKDLVFLRRGSNITTNAIGNNVIGGDININTNFLVAAENSDISANSTDFRGGRVKVEALNILGTEFRNALTVESDITATGATPDLSGTVELNTPDVDPSKGLVELPINIVDASQQIAQGCTPRGEQISSFVVTGRGGLSDSPNEMLSDDAIEVNLVTLDPKVNHSSPTVSAIAPAPTPIVEAQGLVKNKNGELLFTASASTATPNHLGLTQKSCSMSQQRN
ncbi:filamentous hemagglutinin N-terminal domain-containing protein [Nostoc sp. T09]|uniref:two-partner secretion domain-containing protein n=1 Tax=Nostoc sp. T09 TaxID=1932621 RepID=UPI00211B51A5|nr:filamentous hemagglutinin N-terminal domain-containing protein [Nostoc sp. T09]